MPTIVLQLEFYSQAHQPHLYRRNIMPKGPCYGFCSLFTMACQQSHHQTNPVKRPRSSFESTPSGQVNCDIPFDHYAIIYTDSDGRVIVDCSHSIRDGISSVIPTEARRNFLVTLGQKCGFREPDTGCMLLVHAMPQII